jgi:hypothetical protein
VGVLAGFIDIPNYLYNKISDDVPVTKLDKINRILFYNVYRCIGLPFYRYHNYEIVDGGISSFVRKSLY